MAAGDTSRSFSWKPQRGGDAGPGRGCGRGGCRGFCRHLPRDSNPSSNHGWPGQSVGNVTHIHGHGSCLALQTHTYPVWGHDDASSVSFVWANACAVLPRPVLICMCFAKPSQTKFEAAAASPAASPDFRPPAHLLPPGQFGISFFASPPARTMAFCVNARYGSRWRSRWRP